MKISWGVKIIIVFAVFAAGIFSMVAVSMMNNTDLVNENYYEQEIKYQDQINLLNRSVHLNDKILLTQDGNELILDISGLNSSDENNYEGNIFFYRGSDAKKDFDIKFNPDKNGIQKISAEKLEKGFWKVRLNLKQNGEDYFVEKKIFIN